MSTSIETAMAELSEQLAVCRETYRILGAAEFAVMLDKHLLPGVAREMLEEYSHHVKAEK